MKRLFLLSLVGAALALSGCGGAPQQHTTEAAKPGMVKDPVCGMEIDPAKAVKAEHGGKTYSFCSNDCRDRFLKNPAEYTK